MDDPTRQRLIQDYRASLRPFDEAVAALKGDEMDDRPDENAWSPREVIHHVADTEAIAAGRLRLLLARDHAPIASYDEEELNRVSDALARSLDVSLQSIRVLHQANLQLLEAIGGAMWLREADHETDGRYDLSTWVLRRVEHLRLHSDQLRDVSRHRV